MKATKKPVTIECVKWDGENLEEVQNFCGISYIGGGKDDDKKLVISTLEGDMLASVGDFIIRGVKGEFYPCKPDIFEQTYDIVESAAIPEYRFDSDERKVSRVTRGKKVPNVAGSTPAIRDKKLETTKMPTQKEYQEEYYEPFGKEWEKSVMRIRKATIVKMYRKVCIEKLRLEEKMKETK